MAFIFSRMYFSIGKMLDDFEKKIFRTLILDYHEKIIQ